MRRASETKRSLRFFEAWTSIGDHREPFAASRCARHGEAPGTRSIPSSTSCHTFRATGITAYLENGGAIEDAQLIAAHESPRTTKLYDRTGDEITLDEVERIVI